MTEQQRGDKEEKAKERKARAVAATNQEHDARIKAKANDLQTTAAHHVLSSVQGGQTRAVAATNQEHDARIKAKANDLQTTAAHHVLSSVQGGQTTGLKKIQPTKPTDYLQALDERITNKINSRQNNETGQLSNQEQILKQEIAVQTKQRIQDLEANALAKQQLPGNDPQGADDAYMNDRDIDQAKAIDETQIGKQRAAIAQKIQDEIISKAEVATAFNQESEKQAKQNRLICIIVSILLISIMAIVAGVCGSGKCASSDDTARADHTARASAITSLINAESLTVRDTSVMIDYPNNGTTPEQVALGYLIDNDILELSVDGEADWRLLQRYALLVVWLTNGPFIQDDWEGWETVATAAEEWLVNPNECSWWGVVCNDASRVVALNQPRRGMIGTIPRDLALLTDLAIIDFNNNDLNGRMSDAISVLGDLSIEHLDLSDNKFEGTIPEALSQFTALTVLDFEYNGLTGTIPDSISSLTNLEVLEICNQFCGLSWGGCGDPDVNVGGTAIPTWLASFSSLKKLSLFDCRFTSDPIPYEIFETMKDLEELKMGEWDDNGQVHSLSKLSGLSKLKTLTVSGHNYTEGSLPAEIGNWWPEMVGFDIRGGSDLFVGSLPSSIAQWTNLHNLGMTSQRITGAFPEGAFANWSHSLARLSLGKNNMSGTLPSEIGLCSDLFFLDLSYNSFTGTLPTEIGLLTDLNVLWLDGNEFSGTIPTEIVEIGGRSGRSSQNLNFNNFTGVSPWCLLNMTAGRLKRFDCDKVSCPCCEYCN